MFHQTCMTKPPVTCLFTVLPTIAAKKLAIICILLFENIDRGNYCNGERFPIMCRETARRATSVQIWPFVDRGIENEICSLRGCRIEKSFVFEKMIEITSHVRFPIMSKHIVHSTRCMTTLALDVPEIS